MCKFTCFVKFDLEMKNNIPIITCKCNETYEIEDKLFDNSKELFYCPHCNELWHFERTADTIVLINPSTNFTIPLRKNRNKWILDKR